MRPGYRSAPASFAGCGLACLLLVFGLVAQPLLVQCIREDGRVLIEIAGHDTCHEEAGQDRPVSGARRSPSPAVGPGEWHDPCLDLSLYKPADARAGADLCPHLSDSGALQPGAAADCAPRESHVPVREMPPKLLPRSSAPSLFALRI